MEAAIRSVQVGSTSQQAAASQQPQNDISGPRQPQSGGPQHNLPPQSMSSYQPRGGSGSSAAGINDHRSSVTNSTSPFPPYASHYDPSRGRARPPFSVAPSSGKTSFSWQPANTQFEFAPRTSVHQPTIGSVPNSYVSAANFHPNFAPRVAISSQPPPSQSQSQQPQQQVVPNVSTHAQLLSNEYIGSSNNASANAAANARLHQSQPQNPPPSQQNQRQSQPQSAPPPSVSQQQQQHPEQGGQSQSQSQSQQPAYKKIRLSETYQHQTTNSLHHPSAAAPSSMPVRVHQYEKAGIPNHVVLHVAPQQQQQQQQSRQMQQQSQGGNTAEIQYQSKQQSQPQQHVSTAASPQSVTTASNNAASNSAKIPLKIDTRDPQPMGYHPKTEAISPAGSPKLSKDDLLQQISSVDTNMMVLEERKRVLKEKEKMIMDQKEKGGSEEVEEKTPFRHRTLAQQIYADNKKKALESHVTLTSLNYRGVEYDLPLYNQPSDSEICRKIHEQYLTFRSSLILHLRKIKSERAKRNQELSDKYAKLSVEWLKRVEKVESTAKRKAREARNRDLFEKVFVELRKQREDKERFNRVGSRVKSEADFEVIVDGLQEQAQEDKKMRSYAVIPPIMFDNRQRRLVFQNENGSKVDMETELSAYKTVNLWTTGEKETFRDKYIQNAKNFGSIANSLERKSAQDCVRYYYLSKKDTKYKQLLRKSSRKSTRSTKNLPKSNESQSLLDLMTTGVTTRLQRKSRNTSRPSGSSANASAGNAASSDNQTARSTPSSSVTMPTVTVTLKSNLQPASEAAVKDEIDPLSTTNTSSPASNNNTDVKVKIDPDGDVVMKTETSDSSSNWSSTYPPNGLNVNLEIKPEDIKQEKSPEGMVKLLTNILTDEKKLEASKESEDKENEDVKNKMSSHMEVDGQECDDQEGSAKRRKIEESGTTDKDKNQSADNGQNKTNKQRFMSTNCPLPTCPNPKDRVKRFRNLPSRLFELTPEERDPIIKELQIPPNVTKCCSACLTRIKRKMGAQLLGTTPLTDEEIQQFRKQLQEIGPKWKLLAEQLSKSATLLKTIYFHYEKKYGFDQAVNEYYKVHVNEDRRPVTDGDESDVSVTSSDYNENESSGKESSEVKKNEGTTNDTNSPINLQTPTNKDSAGTNSDATMKDERLIPPPLGQPPPLVSSMPNLNAVGHPQMIPVMLRTKKHSEDYDSSATETADEENESTPANRQSSPKTGPPSMFGSTKLNSSTTISSISTPSIPNPPANVRDAISEFIERSLKSSSKAPPVPVIKPIPPPVLQTSSQPKENSSDVTFVGSYQRQETGQNKIQIQPQRRTNSESLATLSVVNSLNQSAPNPPNIPGHALNFSSIAATITPVPPQRPSSNPAADKTTSKPYIPTSSSMNQSEPEPQTLDLSIKKPHQSQPQERSFPTFAKTVVPPPTGGSTYRGDPSITAQPSLPGQGGFMAFHPDIRKSPGTYITPSISPSRVMTMTPHNIQQQQHQQQMQAHQQQQQQQQQHNKTIKVTPKLSPKVQNQPTGSAQQMNGPKGSITLGTPLNDNRQSIMIQGSGGNQNQRYDMMRQTPPQNDSKIGSITAGTPIQMNEKRVHEYMKNSRHSPANHPNVSQAGTGSPHPSQQFTSPYRPQQHTGEMNSTQALLFSDFLTSQQMQGGPQGGHRGGPQNFQNTINIISGPAPGKESPSPRSIAHGQQMYYADKERERPGSGQTRTEYLSRSSPADHQNNTTSPHRTPPPQPRQGVIQRHNAGGSKPPSPAPPRTPMQGGSFHPHHYLQGHDALNSLVDVAVAQPSLPVPNELNRRHMPQSESPQSSLPPPRERYPYGMHPVEMLPIFQQQQQQLEILRRQEIQQHNERKERQEREFIQEQRQRERDEVVRRIEAAERDRERDEVQRARIEAERRNEYERERMERFPVWRGQTGRPGDEVPQSFTAQSLINAIITENIQRPQEARERYVLGNRLQGAGENNGSSHPSNVIKIDVDGDRHTPQSSSIPSKNIKIADITDAVIAKDPSFGLSTHPPSVYLQQHPLTRYSLVPPPKGPSPQQQQQSNLQMIHHPMGQEQIIATDQWKLNRRIQQQQAKEDLKSSNSGPQGRSTPDDRNSIIRISQSPSPRAKTSYEPVSPPEPGHYYQQKPAVTINERKMTQSGPPPSDGQSGEPNNVLKFFNSKIAEAMRSSEDLNDHGNDAKDGNAHMVKSFERPRSGNGIPDSDSDKSSSGKRGESPYSQQGRPPTHPPIMYPCSALTFPQVGFNPIISPKAANELIDANRQSAATAQQPQHLDSRQVLSEQYDALSDED